MFTEFMQAQAADAGPLVEFLAAAKLGAAEVKTQYESYTIAKNKNGDIVGAAGLIPYGKSGLLRSCVFARSFPKEQIPYLIEQLITRAGLLHLEALFLAVDKEQAALFFQALGFVDIAAGQLPADVKSSPHVENLALKKNCRFMYRTL